MKKALETMFTVELMEDNVETIKERIREMVSGVFGWNTELKGIVDRNVVCSDIEDWDLDNWKPYPKSEPLF